MTGRAGSATKCSASQAFARLVRLARWCDVYFQNNISLATLWPPLLLDKPLIVTHAGWIQRDDGSRRGAIT